MLFPPNEMNDGEIERMFWNRPAKFSDLYDELRPIAVRGEAGDAGLPTDDDLNATLIFLRHTIAQNQHRADNEESDPPNEETTAECIDRLAPLSVKIFSLVARLRDGRLQLVDRVLLIHYCDRVSDELDILETLNPGPQGFDQETVLKLARVVVRELSVIHRHPQGDEKDREFAGLIGDREWAPDVGSTLDSLSDTSPGHDAELQRWIAESFAIVRRLHQTLASFSTRTPLMNRVEALNLRISNAKQSVTLPALTQILDHAGRITGGLMGHSAGIFARPEDEDGMNSRWTAALRWAVLYWDLLNHLRVRGELDEDGIRVFHVLRLAHSLLNYLRKFSPFTWILHSADSPQGNGSRVYGEIIDLIDGLRNALVPGFFGRREGQEGTLLRLASDLIDATYWDRNFYPYPSPGKRDEYASAQTWLQSIADQQAGLPQELLNDNTIRDHLPSLPYLLRRILQPRPAQPQANVNAANDQHHLRKSHHSDHSLRDTAADM